ncbi:hypothetical protein BGX23_003164 [Mortierella sp. AD031]|nr:hypothetical protein BGX23_003164 [Mortierella sp. AD031]
MEYQQGAQQPYGTQHQGGTRSPNPPVLSFRTFHATHFSWSQRQAFFGGGAPAPPPWGYHHPPPSSPSAAPPVGTDTLAEPPAPAPGHAYEGADPQPSNTEGCATTDLHSYHNIHTESRNIITTVGDEIAEPDSGLTQEAIEIFEFSRRFREEKAAALELERARMARRRTKRRRLTKRGFAPDEGNSGSDEPTDSSDLDQGRGGNKQGGYGGDAGSSDDNEDDGADEDDGEGLEAQTEHPATDIAFLTQPSRQRDRNRQKLYGAPKKAGKGVSSSSSTPSVAESEEMWSIRMLEAMLNQTYIDSLGPGSALPTKEEGSGQRRSRDSRGAARSKSVQQSQVVYWPGMPMRC